MKCWEVPELLVTLPVIVNDGVVTGEVKVKVLEAEPAEKTISCTVAESVDEKVTDVGDVVAKVAVSVGTISPSQLSAVVH